MDDVVRDAEQLIRAGQWADARSLLQGASQQSPASVSIWMLLARVLAHLRELDKAGIAIEKAISLAPDDGQSRLLAARIFHDAGESARSLEHAYRVPRDDSAYASARYQAGVLLADLQRNDDAAEAFQAAVDAQPGYVRALGNLASMRLKQRRVDDAIAAANAALAVQPGYAHAHFIHASAHLAGGRVQEALRSLETVLANDPGYADAWLMMSRIHRQQQAIEPALAAVQQLLQIDPGRTDGLCLLGDILMVRGDLSAAKNVYAQVLRKVPNHLESALRHALMLPVTYANLTHIDDARTAFVLGLGELEKRQTQFAQLPPHELLGQIQYSNFYLAYQGADDLDIQRRYARFVARLLAAVLPQHFLPLQAQFVEQRRIRIGVASRFFYTSTAGNYFESWITDLPRDRFDVSVFYTLTQEDELTARIRQRADFFAPYEPSLDRLATQVAARNLDILVYPELGMDSRLFALAALRLAPVQIAGWGHPVTSGHDNIDYFLSCAAMEPDDAKRHYHERLLMLPGLGTRYPRPVLDSALRGKGRDSYQLPEHKNLYLVPQSLFKIHPDNDGLLVDVLAADPDGVLVMFAGQAQSALQQFIVRLNSAFSARGLATAGRVKILPEVGHADYQRINELCDVMLDTLHWSGGNTSLDALAFGLPIVTLPGKMMRGRQSMAMLKILGVEELIAKDAKDYVSIAIRIGRNRDVRHALSRRIVAALPKLFDDREPPRVLADIFERLTIQGHSSTIAQDS